MCKGVRVCAGTPAVCVRRKCCLPNGVISHTSRGKKAEKASEKWHTLTAMYFLNWINKRRCLGSAQFRIIHTTKCIVRLLTLKLLSRSQHSLTAGFFESKDNWLEGVFICISLFKAGTIKM